MIGTLYLGALAAGERMAQHLGDTAAAALYRQVYDTGRKRLDELLWAGGFYVQRVPDPKSIPADHLDAGRIKYQYGDGCLSDQLLGQWFAEVVGLGRLLPADHVRQALTSIYQHNFRRSFADLPNTQRIFALNDEMGLLLCTWPNGNRPALPFVYSDEVWTGIEYQVAAHLIYEGLVSEGLAITKAVRDRYDGQRRNPWNEVECGNHYARALSSWSLLTALSGYRYSGPDAVLAFAPRINAADFRCFFTTGTSWGTYRQTLGRGNAAAFVDLQGGALTLKALEFDPRLESPDGVSAAVSGRTLPGARYANGAVRFDPPASFTSGQTLEIRIRSAAARARHP
jgi:non-lysosomal glucosylceramidase